MCGFENPDVGKFSASEKEKKDDPELEKKMSAANEALKTTDKVSGKNAGEQARDSLKKALEEIPGGETEKEAA